MILKHVVHDSSPHESPLTLADQLRLAASDQIDDGHRSEFGQFMTPAPVAHFMAGIFALPQKHIRLLDPGAAVGSLTAAFVEEACARREPPYSIEVTAFEVDPMLVVRLEQTLSACRARCELVGVKFSSTVMVGDFIDAMVSRFTAGIFGETQQGFTHVLMNPPYRKIRNNSAARAMLAKVGIETSNLYTAFMALAVRAMVEGGEFVAITPRSFCNGPYFKPFRHAFLRDMALSRFHLFDSRKDAFRDDDVLQENIITYAVRRAIRPQSVIVSVSDTPASPTSSTRIVPYAQVVGPTDPDAFIHIVADDENAEIASRMVSLPSTIKDLDLQVSTGRVVDFRATEYLRAEPSTNTVPLIYPCNMQNGGVEWPREGQRKAKAIVAAAETEPLLVDTGFYVLVKRFSAKEEPRRVVAAVFEPKACKGKRIGFENHLNYFHVGGHGMDSHLAYGLAMFLNSSEVDLYFRQFNGHTQVNASDLRKLHFPPRSVLERLSQKCGCDMPSNQEEIDAIVAAAIGWNGRG